MLLSLLTFLKHLIKIYLILQIYILERKKMFFALSVIFFARFCLSETDVFNLYYTENCLELVVTIPTPRDCWIRIETFRMSPRMRQPEISRGSQSDYSTPRLAAAVGTLGNFFRKTFASPSRFREKIVKPCPNY